MDGAMALGQMMLWVQTMAMFALRIEVLMQASITSGLYLG